MKNLLLVSVLLLMSLACKKEETFCFTCTATQITTPSGMIAQTVTTTTEKCDITVDDAKATEKAGTSTTIATGSGVKVTVKTTMVCRKK